MLKAVDMASTSPFEADTQPEQITVQKMKNALLKCRTTGLMQMLRLHL